MGLDWIGLDIGKFISQLHNMGLDWIGLCKQLRRPSGRSLPKRCELQFTRRPKLVYIVGYRVQYNGIQFGSLSNIEQEHH